MSLALFFGSSQPVLLFQSQPRLNEMLVLPRFELTKYL